MTTDIRGDRIRILLFSRPDGQAHFAVRLSSLLDTAADTADQDLGPRPIPPLLHHTMVAVQELLSGLVECGEPASAVAFYGSSREVAFAHAGGEVHISDGSGAPVDVAWFGLDDPEAPSLIETRGFSLLSRPDLDVNLRWSYAADASAAEGVDVDAQWNGPSHVAVQVRTFAGEIVSSAQTGGQGARGSFFAGWFDDLESSAPAPARTRGAPEPEWEDDTEEEPAVYDEQEPAEGTGDEGAVYDEHDDSAADTVEPDIGPHSRSGVNDVEMPGRPQSGPGSRVNLTTPAWEWPPRFPDLEATQGAAADDAETPPPPPRRRSQPEGSPTVPESRATSHPPRDPAIEDAAPHAASASAPARTRPPGRDVRRAIPEPEAPAEKVYEIPDEPADKVYEIPDDDESAPTASEIDPTRAPRWADPAEEPTPLEQAIEMDEAARAEAAEVEAHAPEPAEDDEHGTAEAHDEEHGTSQSSEPDSAQIDADAALLADRFADAVGSRRPGMVSAVTAPRRREPPPAAEARAAGTTNDSFSKRNDLVFEQEDVAASSVASQPVEPEDTSRKETPVPAGAAYAGDIEDLSPPIAPPEPEPEPVRAPEPPPPAPAPVAPVAAAPAEIFDTSPMSAPDAERIRRRVEWPTRVRSRRDPRSAWLRRAPWIGSLAVLFAFGWWIGVRPGAPAEGLQRSLVEKLLIAVGLGGPRYTLTITSVPLGAKILVDGRPTSLKTPADVEVKVGPHQITLAIPEYGDATFGVTGEAGARVKLEAQLAGSLQILAPPTGPVIEVTLDGIPQGYAPLRINQLDPGPHEVEFAAPGQPTWAQTVRIPVRGNAEVTARPFDLPPTGLLEVRATFTDDEGTEELKGAAVYVDGERRGVTPLSLELTRGPHSVRASYRDEASGIQVLDLPGGNQRYANFSFGLGSPTTRLDLDALPLPLSAVHSTTLSAKLVGVARKDLREMWLHVKSPEGTWRRYGMTLLESPAGSVGVVVFPTTMLDDSGHTTYYVSALSLQGEEYFTDLQSTKQPPPAPKPAPRRAAPIAKPSPPTAATMP